MVMRSLLLVLLLSIAACGPSLQVLPDNKAQTLAGDWSMPTAEHERLITLCRNALQQAQQRDEEKMRRQRRQSEDDSIVARPPMDMQWMQQEHEQQITSLLKVMVPGEQLLIEQTAPEALTFKSAGTAVRHFDTRNGSTLMTDVATWRISSGWQSNTFMVVSRDASQSMTITEHYQRRGDTLWVEINVSMPGVKLDRFATSYRRAG